MLVEAPGYYPFRTTETIAAGEARRRHLPRRARVVQPVRRHGHRRPGRARRSAARCCQRRGDRQGAGHRRRSARGRPELRRRGAHRRRRRRSSCAARRPRTRRSSSTAPTVPLIYHFGGLRSVIPVGMLEQHRVLPGQLLADVRPGHRRHHRRADQGAAAARRSAATPTSASSTPASTWRRRSATRAASRSAAGAATSTSSSTRWSPTTPASTWSPRPATTTTSCSPTTARPPAHDIRGVRLRLRRPAELLFEQPGRHRSHAVGAIRSRTPPRSTGARDLPLRPGRQLREHLRLSRGPRLDRLPARAARHRRRHLHLPSYATPPATGSADWLSLSFGVDVVCPPDRLPGAAPAAPQGGAADGQRRSAACSGAARARARAGGARPRSSPSWSGEPLPEHDAAARPARRLRLDVTGQTVAHVVALDPKGALITTLTREMMLEKDAMLVMWAVSRAAEVRRTVREAVVVTIDNHLRRFAVLYTEPLRAG